MEEMSPPCTERGPSLLLPSLLKALQLLQNLVGMHTSYRTLLQSSLLSSATGRPNP